MIKPKTLFLFVLLLITAAVFLISTKVRLDKEDVELWPERIGEKIIYDIKLGKLCLGSATFNYVGKTEVNGRLLNLMIFKTRLAHFRDTEKIYSDPETLLPLKIERNIINVFMKEKIVEDYDQANFTVTIRKKTLLKEKETLIKKDGSIHNAILLPHYIRRMPNLYVGQTFVANLPNNRFEIKLVSIEDIKVPAGVFKAYRFESTPKQIAIWISADKRRLPVKIKGIGAYAYKMVMKEYKP